MHLPSANLSIVVILIYLGLVCMSSASPTEQDYSSPMFPNRRDYNSLQLRAERSTKDVPNEISAYGPSQESWDLAQTAFQWEEKTRQMMKKKSSSTKL